MSVISTQSENYAQKRIASVDFFRGVTMFLLAGEASLLFENMRKYENPVIKFLGYQLDHHEWHGMHFWDLIQPFFMFIVGVAIPFAVANRLKKGETEQIITRHAVKRSGILLFLGWALYFIDAGGLVFRFQCVLAQLSAAYLVAFLIRNKSYIFQLATSLVILLFIDLAYRFFPLEGFNHPWVMYENLGAWFNNTIEGEVNITDWATLNFVSTTAHTIWGVMCGKLLMSNKTDTSKLQVMFIAGFVSLFIGYSLDLLNITPIIKKIATSSFVFVSAGYTIWALSFCYWLIDVKKIFLKGSRFFIIMGANSIFIYIFFSSGGVQFLTHMLAPFNKLAFFWLSELNIRIISCISVWFAMWYLCYWLYINKIFIKI